jgi:hypothetical protein
MSRNVLFALATGIALVGCAADARPITGLSAERSQSATIVVGREIDITLGSIGPAVYADPPAVSSAALIYLGVSDVPPYTPGGLNQQFRFRAAAPGEAIVTFRRMWGDSLISKIEDTIQVQ